MRLVNKIILAISISLTTTLLGWIGIYYAAQPLRDANKNLEKLIEEVKNLDLSDIKLPKIK